MRKSLAVFALLLVACGEVSTGPSCRSVSKDMVNCIDKSSSATGEQVCGEVFQDAVHKACMEQ